MSEDNRQACLRQKVTFVKEAAGPEQDCPPRALLCPKHLKPVVLKLTSSEVHPFIPAEH